MKNRIFLFLMAILMFSGVIKGSFIINKPFDEYLQENSENPNISLGTEHFTDQNISDNPIYGIEEMDQHKLPHHLITHQGSYVINFTKEMNPDLIGDVRDQEIWDYLLEKGEETLHLIWEEHIDVAALTKNYYFVDNVYNLLRDGGYFVFVPFDDSPVKKLRVSYPLFYETLKEKFGEHNIVRYDFNDAIYRVKKHLIQEGQIVLNEEEYGEWDYSSLDFPLTVEVVLRQFGRNEVERGEVKKWLLNNEEKIERGIYRYDEDTSTVYEKITVESIEVLKEFDERTRKVSLIDPVLAKYPHPIIVARKNKTDKQPKVRKLKKREKIARVLWEKIRRQPTEVKIVGILSLSGIAFIIASIIYRWKSSRK